MAKVANESLSVKTLYFEDAACLRARPGQFVMLWVPGFNEVPMSLSIPDAPGYAAVTIRAYGPASQQLLTLKKGGAFGLRGPYGRGFRTIDGSALMVGGGTGMAPLALLCHGEAPRFSKVAVVVGARTEGELLLVDKVKKVLRRSGRLLVATDDGSAGFRGSAAEHAAQLMDEERFDSVYVCGPELMIRKVFDAAEARGLPVQASLERVMKCGFGLCGSCCIGEYLVCRDGPVFDQRMLRRVSGELGLLRRDAAGRLVKLG